MTPRRTASTSTSRQAARARLADVAAGRPPVTPSRSTRSARSTVPSVQRDDAAFAAKIVAAGGPPPGGPFGPPPEALAAWTFAETSVRVETLPLGARFKFPDWPQSGTRGSVCHLKSLSEGSATIVVEVGTFHEKGRPVTIGRTAMVFPEVAPAPTPAPAKRRAATRAK